MTSEIRIRFTSGIEKKIKTSFPSITTLSLSRVHVGSKTQFKINLPALSPCFFLQMFFHVMLTQLWSDSAHIAKIHQFHADTALVSVVQKRGTLFVRKVKFEITRDS